MYEGTKGGIEMKCPGQDLRNLRISVVKCPNCSSDVEIFSDEIRVKCQKCGTKVYRDQVPSCIDWCSHARECIGEDRWRELRGDLQAKQETDQKVGG